MPPPDGVENCSSIGIIAPQANYYVYNTSGSEWATLVRQTLILKALYYFISIRSFVALEDLDPAETLVRLPGEFQEGHHHFIQEVWPWERLQDCEDSGRLGSGA